MSVTREEIERLVRDCCMLSGSITASNSARELATHCLTVLDERDSLKSQLAALREENEKLKERLSKLDIMFDAECDY